MDKDTTKRILLALKGYRDLLEDMAITKNAKVLQSVMFELKEVNSLIAELEGLQNE